MVEAVKPFEHPRTRWVVFIAEVRDDVDPARLLYWAQRRRLIEYLAVHEVSHDEAMGIHKGLLDRERSQGGDDDGGWDFYEDLGF